MKVDVKNYLFKISSTKAVHKKIDSKTYDDSLVFIEQAIRFSTKSTFKSSMFWKLIPPKLKQKVVKVTLEKQINTIRFFFEDFND